MQLTGLGGVGLAQQVGQRLHQVPSEQDKKPFEASGHRVAQAVEGQQALGAARLGPVEELQDKRQP